MNEPLFQFPSQVPPIEAVDEFKLQNALYSAEFGMGVGQVSIAMKSGTNELHGFRVGLPPQRCPAEVPAAISHQDAAETESVRLRHGRSCISCRKIYDGRNRTFFFASYNGGRRATGSYGVTQMPTAAERQGDFSTWPTQLFDPLSGVVTPGASLPVSRTPFPGNQIPLNRFAPQSANLIKYWPSPTTRLPDAVQQLYGRAGVARRYGSVQPSAPTTTSPASDRISWQFLHAIAGRAHSLPGSSFRPHHGASELDVVSAMDARVLAAPGERIAPGLQPLQLRTDLRDRGERHCLLEGRRTEESRSRICGAAGDPDRNAVLQHRQRRFGAVPEYFRHSALRRSPDASPPASTI